MMLSDEKFYLESKEMSIFDSSFVDLLNFFF